jgi:hypothetical protein
MHPLSHAANEFVGNLFHESAEIAARVESGHSQPGNDINGRFRAYEELGGVVQTKTVFARHAANSFIPGSSRVGQFARPRFSH